MSHSFRLFRYNHYVFYEKYKLWIISGFRRCWNKVIRLLGCYAAWGDLMPTVLDYLSVPSSRVGGPETSISNNLTLRNNPEDWRIQIMKLMYFFLPSFYHVCLFLGVQIFTALNVMNLECHASSALCKKVKFCKVSSFIMWTWSQRNARYCFRGMP